MSDEFEFFTVAISIILALGIGRLLDGIAPALAPNPRYWVHVGWIANKLINHILWWWGLWAGRDVEWNLAWFVWSLIGPAVLYLQATALVTSTPSRVTSWQDRFFEIRPWFFVGNIVLCANLLIGRAFGPLPLLAPVSVGLAILAVVGVVGVMTENRRAHTALVVIALSVQIAGLGAAMFQAGTL